VVPFKHSVRYFSTRPHKWWVAGQLALAAALMRKQLMVFSDGIFLVCGLGAGQGAWCAATGLDYERELRLFLRLLHPGHYFVDIGANIGTYTIRAARLLGASGRVFAFEPLEANNSRLIAAVQANLLTNVEVVKCAVGDRQGTVIIHDGGRESSASLGHTTGRAFDVRITTLDCFVAETGMRRLDWIKMDIEGQEPVALAGMTRSIDRFRPYFLFENHEGGAETCQTLHRLRYRIGNFDHSSAWEDGTAGENLFAIPSEKFDTLVSTCASGDCSQRHT